MVVEAPKLTRTDTTPGVNRIDHFVVQVNDLWRAYEFYRDILGAKIHAIAGADTERLWHRGNQILFIAIAGHKGVGMSVSNVEVPSSTRLFEHVTQGYEVTDAQFDQLLALLGQRNVPYHGPESYEAGFPLARSIWFQDPDGHTIEVCVRSDGGAGQDAAGSVNEGGPVAPQRISHMRVEVSNVARATRWFEQTLGFEHIANRNGEAYLKVRNGDQMMVLRPTDELSPRRDFVRGPHIDFQTPPEEYPVILQRVQEREGYWESAPHPFPNSRGVDHAITVYFYDPDGNRFQVSPAGSH